MCELYHDWCFIHQRIAGLFVRSMAENHHKAVRKTRLDFLLAIQTAFIFLT